MAVCYVADVTPDLDAEDIKDFDSDEFHPNIDRAVKQLIRELLPIDSMSNANYTGYVYRIDKEEHDLEVEVEIKEVIPISVYTKVEWSIGA
jgi:CRISPR/Cas system CSM-associated protein Csm5 (group 7 of RAMP superfamily)